MFSNPFMGRAKPLEEHYHALRATICVCAIPASTAYANCTTGLNPNLDPPAALPLMPAMPPVEGISKNEKIARYLSVSSLLFLQMRWYSERGLVIPSLKPEMLDMLEKAGWPMEKLDAGKGWMAYGD